LTMDWHWVLALSGFLLVALIGSGWALWARTRLG
jgi:hypothetical protein